MMGIIVRDPFFTPPSPSLLLFLPPPVVKKKLINSEPRGALKEQFPMTRNKTLLTPLQD
jgi:hypothetical protein